MQREVTFSCGIVSPDETHYHRAGVPEGMIRCYMGTDKVVGYGHQFIKALIPPPPEEPDSPAAQPGPRIMHGADAAPFQKLRAKMEDEWVPQIMEVLGIEAASLPIIWDADFLYGPRSASGEDSYVLCEINVSSCFAVPDQAPAVIAPASFEPVRRCAARLIAPAYLSSRDDVEMAMAEARKLRADSTQLESRRSSREA